MSESVKPDELLPCPFCGGHAFLVKAEPDFNDPYVMCADQDHCGVTGPGFPGGGMTEEQVAAAWNRRARPPQDATSATHPAPLTAVERADVVEGRNEVIEECARMADKAADDCHKAKLAFEPGHRLRADNHAAEGVSRDLAAAIRALKAPRS